MNDEPKSDRAGVETSGTALEDPRRPKLFVFDPQREYSWRMFDDITVATVTFNRLEFTKAFLNSVLKYSHLPHRWLIVDNGSTDGTVDYLRAWAREVPNVELVENPRNLGLLRALQQIRDRLVGGLLVYCDNDMEVLSSYWLVLVMKAFHAARLTLGHSDVALGMRMLNLDEYGFRYTSRHAVLPIPHAMNAEPRTSYATCSKDDPDASHRLDETVVVGWTAYLMGGAFALPAKLFRQVRLEQCYPMYIGGTDAFVSQELERLGVPMGYVENGPVMRHNDWPYSEQKLELYARLTTTRAVTDWTYVRWKLRDLLRRLRE